MDGVLAQTGGQFTALGMRGFMKGFITNNIWGDRYGWGKLEFLDCDWLFVVDE